MIQKYKITRFFLTFLVLTFSFFMPISMATKSAFTYPSNMEPSAPSEIRERAAVILGAIQVVAVAIAVGMLIHIGIKYVMSSANERADVKQAAVNYVIGAIIIATAPTILKLLYDFFVKARNAG